MSSLPLQYIPLPSYVPQQPIAPGMPQLRPVFVSMPTSLAPAAQAAPPPQLVSASAPTNCSVTSPLPAPDPDVTVRVERVESQAPPQAPQDQISPHDALHFFLSALLGVFGLLLSLILTRKKERPTISMLTGLATHLLAIGSVTSLFGVTMSMYTSFAVMMALISVVFNFVSAIVFYFAWMMSKTPCNASDFVLNMLLNILVPLVALPFSAFQRRRRAALGGFAGSLFIDGISIALVMIIVARLGIGVILIGSACLAAHLCLFILCIAKAGKDNMQLAESLTYCALVFAFGPLGVIPGIFAKTRSGRYGMYFSLILLALLSGIALALSGIPAGIAVCALAVFVGLPLAWVYYDRTHGRNE